MNESLVYTSARNIFPSIPDETVDRRKLECQVHEQQFKALIEQYFLFFNQGTEGQQQHIFNNNIITI